jgi:hypothetical protein
MRRGRVYLWKASGKYGINHAFIESGRLMKCILCSQKKAKRFCPAKNDQICAPCCGEKRVLEIDCPESCEYLKLGREREAQEYGKRLRSLHSTAQDRVRKILMERQDVVAHLEYALSQQRRQSRHLADKDVKQALDIQLENYATEDKGVLYEKTSEDLQVESIRRELRGIIESYRNPEGAENRGIVDPKSTRLQLSEAIGCLEFMQSLVSSYLEEKHSNASYVDFLLRITPREESRSSIIAP